MTNLAHLAHRTAESELQRARLRARLTDVMREHGTTPDEIEWPALDVIALEPAASIV